MNRIRELRLSKKMSQAALGGLLGCAGQTISKLEGETRQLDPGMIHALCDFFGCTSDYLLCRTDTPLPVITDEDARILNAYHQASERDQGLINQILASYMKVDKNKSA